METFVLHRGAKNKSWMGAYPYKKEIIYTTPSKAHMTEKGVERS